MVDQVVPPALMFSVCFIIGQFSVNKELVAIMVAGVSFIRIITPILFFGFVVWIVMTIFGQLVVIPSNRLAQIEYSIMAKGSNRLSTLYINSMLRVKMVFITSTGLMKKKVW